MVKMVVILSATRNAWGYLFKEEEREREIKRFRKELDKIYEGLPEDLKVEVHSFTDASRETEFVNSLGTEDPVVYCALSFGTPGLDILLEKKIPIIFYQQMYAGHTWNIKEIRRDNVILLMGSEIKDLTPKIRVLYAYRMYLGMEALIKDKDADGITVDCLSLFGTMKAYPCIGFTLLNNRGIPAACEGDVFSLFTMYMFNYITGLPSYISDPVVDTSKNTVIHAHCVAPTKIDGENISPYIIRNHAEDNRSVSLQVKFERLNEMMTVANLLKDEDGKVRMLVSTGSFIGNPEINRGCRTKFELKVEDAQRMLDNWPNGKVSCFGLHRVLVYKDWMDEVKNLAGLLNIEVIEE
jgi:hypothetical protein